MASGLVQAADIVSRARILMAEPNVNRWTDAYMLTLATDAQARVAQDVDYIEESKPIAGIPGVGKYPLPPMSRLLRVYLQIPGISQQILPGTDIPTMEGDALLIYDQSSGITGGSPQMTPKWIAEQPQPYPVQNIPDAVPVSEFASYLGVANGQQRPYCYVQGKYIGVQPVPSNAAFTIILDFVPLPPDFTQLSDYSIFPSNFLNTLAYDVCERMLLADGRDGQAQIYESKYQDGIGKLMTNQANFQGNKPKRFAVITKRQLIEWDY